MKRRGFLQTAAAVLAAPSAVRAAERSVVRIVPQSNLGSIDPIWTTATVTRNHGYLVYDTLFGMTSDLQPRPQMAEGLTVDADGRRVSIKLRDGLLFHDGERVRAADCVASIMRWSKRNGFGQKLLSTTDELTALDDQHIQFRLKKPFPLLTSALAVVGQPPFIMPERVAETDPFKQIDDATGSGPFRFRRDEFNPGQKVVYERHPGYVPREAGEPSLTSGPKRVYLDRVEWHVIPDGATAVSALQKGEIDWFEQPTPEQASFLSRVPFVSVEAITSFPSNAIMRLNFLQPPFDNKAVRQALLPAIVPADFMAAVAGSDVGAWQEGGVFTPGTPMASGAGLEPLQGPRSVERAKQLLKAAGYESEPLRLIGPTDLLAPAALTQVAADLFRRLGMNVDVALSDWGTVLQRRASKEPVGKGGWSAALTNFPGFDFAEPGMHPGLVATGTGPGSMFGWPAIPRLEELRQAVFDASDDASRHTICEEMQRVIIDEVAFVPLGAFKQMTALRRDLTERVSGFAMFWSLRRE